MMLWKKSLKTLILAVAAVLLVFSCKCDKDDASTEIKADGSAKKVFNYFRSSAHKSLDPMQQFDSASAAIIANVYDTLLTYHYLERPYKLVPLLLTKMPEKQADGLTFNFEIRKGVKFKDDRCFTDGKGREATIDDVIYSIKRFADNNVNLKSYILIAGFVEGMDEFREKTKELGKKTDYDKMEISGIKKIDKYTMSLKLTRENPLAFYPFAFSGMSILPKEAVDLYKQDFEKQPVGTGPYYMKKYDRRGEIVLAKNPNYFMTYPTEGAPGDKEKGLLKDAGKPLPLLDEIHLPLIEEAQPAMLTFLKGELDWIGMNKDDFQRMAYKDEDGFHLKPDYVGKFNMYTEPGLSAEYWRFNMKDPIVGKGPKAKALRQAIAYATDVQGWINLMRNGRGWPLNTLVPHPIAGSETTTGFKWYEQNLEKARQKLVEAGYPNGEGLPPLTMEYRSAASQTRQDHEYIRAELAKVGISLQGGFQTFSAFLKKTEGGNFQMAGAGWAADYPDGENFFQLLYGPNESPGPNSGYYQNDEYDKLFEQAKYMPNGPERNKIFVRMSEIVKEDVPLLLRWNYLAFGMNPKWVKNMKRNMMLDEPYAYLNIDVDLKAKGLPK